jgi:hypothetical protein
MPRVVDGVAITERNRFSVYVRPKDSQGLADLQKWLAGFTKAGIRAALILTDKGYALYRADMVDMFDEVD